MINYKYQGKRKFDPIKVQFGEVKMPAFDNDRVLRAPKEEEIERVYDLSATL